RKIALGENFENFAAHIARGADDRDFVTHLKSCPFTPPPAPERSPGWPKCLAALPAGRVWPGERVKRFWWWFSYPRTASRRHWGRSFRATLSWSQAPSEGSAVRDPFHTRFAELCQE